MKISTLVLSLVTIVLTANVANAGRPSVPFLPINDLDGEGKPMTPMCPNGWVPSSTKGICKPLNGVDPVFNNKDTNTNNNTNNVSQNQHQNTNVKNTIGDVGSNSNAELTNTNNITTGNNDNNIVLKQGDVKNVSINNNVETAEVGLGDGIIIPTTTFNLTGGAGDHTGEYIQGSIVIPFGGNRKLAKQRALVKYQSDVVSMCTNLVWSGLEIDYTLLGSEYEICKAFTVPPVIEVPVVEEFVIEDSVTFEPFEVLAPIDLPVVTSDSETVINGGF